MVKSRYELLIELYNELHSHMIQTELKLESLEGKRLSDVKATAEDDTRLSKTIIELQAVHKHQGLGLARVGLKIQKAEEEIEKNARKNQSDPTTVANQGH